MNEVSGNRPEPQDHRPKVPTTPTQDVATAMLRTTGPVVTCSCGWSTVHPRAKPREETAQRHLDRHHGGQAIWL